MGSKEKCRDAWGWLESPQLGGMGTELPEVMGVILMRTDIDVKEETGRDWGYDLTAMHNDRITTGVMESRRRMSAKLTYGLFTGPKLCGVDPLRLSGIRIYLSWEKRALSRTHKHGTEELRLGSPSSQDETVNLERCMDVVMLGRDLNVRDAGQEGPVDTRITNRMSPRRGTCLMSNPSADGSYSIGTSSLNPRMVGDARMPVMSKLAWGACGKESCGDACKGWSDSPHSDGMSSELPEVMGVILMRTDIDVQETAGQDWGA
ncbi:hypothetical protein GOP47_0026268 [Adiantum capillus-veneris]|nr:hypothetical protein GOP47_0026268 [Adiantum capillus-veneris]